MKILLIEPKDNVYVADRIYPSGALTLLGSVLHKQGHKVSIIHMFPQKMRLLELKKEIQEFKPEIVGITINTFQTKSAKEIIETVKKISKNITVVVGGPHPSALKREIFKYLPEVDIVVYGEGENTFLEIVAGKNMADIAGICQKNRENPPRQFAQDLNYIPLPNLDLIKDADKLFLKSKKMYIMASRGCPFHCTFCNKSVWGLKARFRIPAHILKEVQWLHDRYGIEEIFFQDDLFNLNREWAEEIFNLLINTGLNKKIAFKIALRANQNLIDEKFLRLAKKASVYSVFIGVESGNQGMLNRMKKGITVKEIKRAFALIHAVGLETTASFIIGLPGETNETIQDSIELCRQINPTNYGFTLPIPFPGTALRKELINNKHLLNENYDEYFLGNCVIRTDKLSQEQLCHYFKKLNAKQNLKMLSAKLTKHYMKNILRDGMENPKSLFKRIKTFLNLLFTYFRR